jgi:hypothetical protein
MPRRIGRTLTRINGFAPSFVLGASSRKVLSALACATDGGPLLEPLWLLRIELLPFEPFGGFTDDSLYADEALSAAANRFDSAATHDPVRVMSAGAVTPVPTMRSMKERRDGSDGDTPAVFRF